MKQGSNCSSQCSLFNGPSNAYQIGKQVRSEWGDFLKTISWDQFCTLTFRKNLSADCARREIQNWIRRINVSVPGGAGYFWIIEKGPAGNRVDVHVLTSFTQDISPCEIKRVWYAGKADVRAHIPFNGSEHYVTKMCDNDDTEFDISPRLRLLQVGITRYEGSQP
jgi:hypothetical protein